MFIGEVIVVVTDHHDQPTVIMETFDVSKGLEVRILDGVVMRMFPQFIPIAGFDVRVPFLIVMIQGMIKDVLILGKVIRQTAIPTMTITEKNQLAVDIDFHPLSLAVSARQPVLGSHRDLLGYFYYTPLIVISSVLSR
jgi:hypothetical protein